MVYRKNSLLYAHIAHRRVAHMKTRKRIEIPPQAVGHLKTIKIIAAAAAPATRSKSVTPNYQF